MNVKYFKSVEDIVNAVNKFGSVYIKTDSCFQSDFIQSELNKFGVRVGWGIKGECHKYIGIFKEVRGLFSSRCLGNSSNEGNTLSFNEFKFLVNSEGDSVILSNTNNEIQDKLKVIEHYLNGGDIQFLGENGKWVALTGCFVLSTIKTHDVRIKPKTYVVDGVIMEKDEILKLLGDE